MSTAKEQQAEERTLAEDLGQAMEELSQEEETVEEEPTEAPEEEVAEVEEETPEEAEPVEAVSEEEAESDEEGPTVEAPRDWSKDWKEKFEQIDSDEGRQLVLDAYKSFQADYTRKTQQIAEVRKVLEPIKDQLALAGLSEGQYVTRLMTADKYLREKPAEAIQWLMNSYGVTPESLGVKAEEDEYADPQVSALQRELRELKQQITTQSTNTQQSQQAELQQQLQSFVTETDDKGHLKHPHFEEVKAHMGGLLQAGAAKDLEDAYEQAVWARPDLRETMLSEREKAAQLEAEKRRKEKAKKAKRAATPSSSGGSKPEEPVELDLRAELEKRFDEMTH